MAFATIAIITQMAKRNAMAPMVRVSKAAPAETRHRNAAKTAAVARAIIIARPVAQPV